MSNSVQPHRWQPTRLLCPQDLLCKNTGVGCYFRLYTLVYEALKNGTSINFYISSSTIGLPVEYKVNHMKATSTILNFLVVTFLKEIHEIDFNNLFHLTQYLQNTINPHILRFCICRFNQQQNEKIWGKNVLGDS